MHDATWHILGAGAIGGLFAAELHRAGIAVQLILRDETRLAQWRERGGIALRDTPTAPATVVDVAAVTAAGLTAPISRLLICTKAHQTAAAIAAIRHALAPQPLLVLLQNGMGVRELLQAQLPRARFLHAISTEGAYRPAPFEVVHAGRGETLIGAAATADQALAEQVATEFHRCALRTRAVADIEARLWLKLVVNSVINPLTALHGCRNGELLQLADIHRRVAALCEEAAAVARADGRLLAAPQLEQTVFEVIATTAANRSSMLQDSERRQATEIDFINGYIVGLAARYGIDCPQQQALLRDIKRLESAAGPGRA
jgi:2-dehydropantoate 2-reductase